MAEKFHSYRVEAIVLRHAEWGEADRLITIFTREGAKLRVIAKGARKIKSRKAGHLEPFTRVTLQLAKSRSFPIVTQAETQDAYLPLRDDLLRTVTASTVIELLDRFTYESEAETPTVFSLLADTLTRITTQSDPWIAVRYYEVQVLDVLGYRPQLGVCANCSNEIQPVDQFFSIVQGGILCPSCGRNLPGSQPVSMTALKTLRHYQRSSYSQAVKWDPPEAVRLEVETLLQRYITYLLERELNSPGFLKQLKED